MERKVIITMNLSVLLGRLVHVPELQKKEKDDSTTYWCRFRVAVDREYAKGQETDFFNCIAYSGRARYLVSCAKKGGRLLVVGRLQTGSYQKNDGTRSYFTELIVADCQIIDFADRESTDSKKEKENQV